VRSLLLVVPLLASLAACWRTDPLYCERSADCADVDGRPFCDVDGTYPGSEGISRTCIADPGGSCTLDVECTDPALPACSNGACRECSPTRACGPHQPVCDVAESTCAGCTSASDCAAFADRPTCSLEDGACVGCTSDLDCAATGQACLDSTRTCGACTADADCESGLCDEVNRSCIAEDAILYVATDGSGTACTKTTPCGTLATAHGLVTETRRHIRAASGRYDGATLMGKSFTLTGDGAILTSDLTIAGTIAIDNVAIERGQVFIQGGSVLLQRLVVTDSEVLPNSAEGAIQLNGGAAIIEDTRVERSRGVAISMADDTNLTITRCTLVNNGLYGAVMSGTAVLQHSRVIANGTGVLTSGERPSLTIVNNVIAQNRAMGMYIGGNPGFAQIEHNTIVFNDFSDKPGGVTCEGVTNRPLFRNNIIWGNTADVPEQQISPECPSQYSLIGPAGFQTGTGNINSDPRFVDGSSANFQLLIDSPARDGADPVANRTPPSITVSTDIDARMRPNGPRADIGAYEYTP
jgi:hypothetical protein